MTRERNRSAPSALQLINRHAVELASIEYLSSNSPSLATRFEFPWGDFIMEFINDDPVMYGSNLTCAIPGLAAAIMAAD